MINVVLTFVFGTMSMKSIQIRPNPFLKNVTPYGSRWKHAHSFGMPKKMFFYNQVNQVFKYMVSEPNSNRLWLRGSLQQFFPQRHFLLFQVSFKITVFGFKVMILSRFLTIYCKYEVDRYINQPIRFPFAKIVENSHKKSLVLAMKNNNHFSSGLHLKKLFVVDLFSVH